MFFARVLEKEGRYKSALVHVIFEAASDAGDLKAHPKSISRYFRKCRFENTAFEEALSLYKKSKGAGDFKAISDIVAGWS